MILSYPSSKASPIQTVPQPRDTPSTIDFSTLVSFLLNSIISLRSLYTCTSAALFISLQSCLNSFTASIFGCQLSFSTLSLVLGVVSRVVELEHLHRFLWDPQGRIQFRAYLVFSFECFIQQQLV